VVVDQRGCVDYQARCLETLSLSFSLRSAQSFFLLPPSLVRLGLSCPEGLGDATPERISQHAVAIPKDYTACTGPYRGIFSV
jgi:hypothetical protein